MSGVTFAIYLGLLGCLCQTVLAASLQGQHRVYPTAAPENECGDQITLLHHGFLGDAHVPDTPSQRHAVTVSARDVTVFTGRDMNCTRSWLTTSICQDNDRIRDTLEVTDHRDPVCIVHPAESTV